LTDTRQLPEGFGKPAVPSRPQGVDAARRLRALTGVDEDLLEIVWHERSRHTALGAVMVGTAAIAAFSMMNFANEALGKASAVAVLPALLWGLFVLCMDRWLVAPQPSGRRRVAPVVLRLGVALVIGAVVAEPLVLRIFQTAIVAQVQSDRHQALDDLPGRLMACNPDPSRPAASPLPGYCGDTQYRLSFPRSAAADQGELAALRTDAAALRSRVDQERNHLDAINSQVLKECAQHIPIAGTDRWERSSECLRLRKVAADYPASHDVSSDVTRLNTADDRIARLTGAVAGGQNTFQAQRDEQIRQRVAEKRTEQGPIGVLERMRALEKLASGNIVLLVGVWLVRLLFVLIDVLPVLVKFFNGETTYDRLLTERSNSAVKVYGEMLHTAERKAMGRFEVERADAEQQVRERKAEFDAARREHTARMNIRVSRAIDQLESELTGSGV
jgi:hypothetical protein